MGTPKDLEKFELFNKSFVNIYVHKDIENANDLLKLNIRSFLFIKEIFVENIRVL